MEKICVAVRVRPPVVKSEEEEEFVNGSYWNVEQDKHSISLHRRCPTAATPLPPALSYTFGCYLNPNFSCFKFFFLLLLITYSN